MILLAAERALAKLRASLGKKPKDDAAILTSVTTGWMQAPVSFSVVRPAARTT